MIIIKIQAGLGNQLFQYAFARKLAIKFNCSLKLDLSFYSKEKYKGIYRLDNYNIIAEKAEEKDIKVLKNIFPDSILSRIIYKSKIPGRFNKRTHIFSYSDEIGINNFNNIFPPVYLEGWFVDFRFFDNVRNVILSDISLVRQLKPASQKILDAIISCKNSVSIHLRRGDYKTNSFFNLISESYYHKAMKEMIQRIDNPHFFIFSDEIDEAKKILNSDYELITYVDCNSKKQSVFNTYGDIEDLELMRNCKNNIIANSTFSLWAAYLNNYNDKIICVPEVWYKDKTMQRNFENNSVLPESWIRI